MDVGSIFAVEMKPSAVETFVEMELSTDAGAFGKTGQNDCMKRVVVVGAPGSGKSTFSRALASSTGLKAVERDGLGRLDSDEYRANVDQLLTTRGWIFDGFPYYVDDVVYGAIDTVFLLDYARRIVMWRVLRRSAALTRRNTMQGAHASASPRQWLDPNHAFRVAVMKYSARRKEMAELRKRLTGAGTNVITFRHPREAAAWLESEGP